MGHQPAVSNTDPDQQDRPGEFSVRFESCALSNIDNFGVFTLSIYSVVGTFLLHNIVS